MSAASVAIGVRAAPAVVPATLAMPVLLAVVGAATWLTFGPPTPDLAAQVHRVGLLRDHGFLPFDLQWFAGHHLPGYSLLFPPLGELLGPRVLGAVAAVVSTALFARLATAHWGERARAGVLWFAVASISDLVIGRLTFALGVAVGLAALLALQRERRGLACVLGVGCAASSPVAGLLLALAGLALTLGERRRDGLWLASAAFVPTVLVSLAFPEGGRQPFGTGAALVVVGACAAAWRLAPPEHRWLRVGAVLYAVGTLAALVLPTPMGSNATRLLALFGGPLLLCALAGRDHRRVTLAVLFAFLAGYQWYGPVRELVKGAVDPSGRAAYHRPLVEFLDARLPPGQRVHVPSTRLHWEAVWVGRAHPLARGWETQLDIKYNGRVRHPSLSPAEYRRWLDARGVGVVAVPDVALDTSSSGEAAVIARRPAFLRPVWRDAHWTVFAVVGARGYGAPGRLRVLADDPGSLRLAVDRPGRSVLRVHWTPYWRVTGGRACVSRAPGGWTAVETARPGRVTLAARFDAERLVRRGRRCG